MNYSVISVAVEKYCNGDMEVYINPITHETYIEPRIAAIFCQKPLEEILQYQLEERLDCIGMSENENPTKDELLKIVYPEETLKKLMLKFNSEAYHKLFGVFSIRVSFHMLFNFPEELLAELMFSQAQNN